MSLISGIVDFFSKTSLDAADLDSSNKAIVDQIGGVSYTGTTPNIGGGALDNNNIGSVARFSNSQKAEPYFTGVVGFCAASFSDALAADAKYTAFAPAVPANFKKIGMVFGADSGASSLTGDVTIKVNGSAVAIVDVGFTHRYPGVPPPSAGQLRLDTAALKDVGFSTRPGDIVSIDLSGVAVGGATISNFNIHLWYTALHLG